MNLYNYANIAIVIYRGCHTEVYPKFLKNSHERFCDLFANPLARPAVTAIKLNQIHFGFITPIPCGFDLELDRFVTHDIEEAVYPSDHVLLIGGQPAQIVEEYNISISHRLRREHSDFLDIVKDIRKGLQSYFDTTFIAIV